MAEQGWVAECQDCPTTIGEDYGQTIKVHQEFAPNARVDANLWALLHSDRHSGHHVDVKWFARWDVEATAINPEVWRILTGGGPT